MWGGEAIGMRQAKRLECGRRCSWNVRNGFASVDLHSRSGFLRIYRLSARPSPPYPRRVRAANTSCSEEVFYYFVVYINLGGAPEVAVEVI